MGGSGGGAKPPERSRKFKIFTEKTGDFYEILKEFNVNDNSSFIRIFSWFFAEFLEIFRRILRKFFTKLGHFFKVLLFYHTVSKTLSLYNGYLFTLLTLIQNNIGRSYGIMYEKIFRKEYKEVMKIWALFAF